MAKYSLWLLEFVCVACIIENFGSAKPLGYGYYDYGSEYDYYGSNICDVFCASARFGFCPFMCPSDSSNYYPSAESNGPQISIQMPSISLFPQYPVAAGPAGASPVETVKPSAGDAITEGSSTTGEGSNNSDSVDNPSSNSSPLETTPSTSSEPSTTPPTTTPSTTDTTNALSSTTETSTTTGSTTIASGEPGETTTIQTPQ